MERARAPIRPRPKSYALADFLVYVYPLLPIIAEETLVNAQLYTTVTVPQATANYTGPEPNNARPRTVGMVLSLARPACLNSMSEALRALVEGAGTLLLLATEVRLRVKLLGGLKEKVSESAAFYEQHIRS